MNAELKERLVEYFYKICKNIIFEYSIERNKVEDSIIENFPNLVIHWCLIKYSKNIKGITCDNHWRVELINYFKIIMSKKINKDTSFKIKRKLIRSFLENYGYYSPKMIYETIYNKFIEDFGSFNDDIVKSVCVDFISDLDIIIGFIGNEKSFDEMREYVHNL